MTPRQSTVGRKCAGCGNEEAMLAKRANGRYCSVSCRNRADYLVRAAARLALIGATRSCTRCGAKWRTVDKKRTAKWCSIQCGQLSYRENQRAHIKVQKAAYRAKNIERVKANKAIYYQANKGKSREGNRRYYARHPQRVLGRTEARRGKAIWRDLRYPPRLPDWRRKGNGPHAS